ncbi:MAG: nuclear transport factor 2 family protein [Caulobacter sp.]|nr:nuclear transport factor 2 family protein [Caulobacter sp.]
MKTMPEVLEEAFQAFNTRDLPRLRTTLHVQGVWPDTLGTGGDVVGIEAVMAHFAQLFAMARPDIQLIQVLETTPDSVTVEAQYLVEDPQGNVWSDTRATLIYHLREGLLSGMTIVSGF